MIDFFRQKKKEVNYVFVYTRIHKIHETN